MKEYKTISTAVTSVLTEKRSEFIARLSPVTDVSGANLAIESARFANHKARHHCYAYVLRENNVSRHSDDGEPSGTAGMPILAALQKSGLTDVICVVSRHFGGILLGAPGLTRAYGNAAGGAVAMAETLTLTPAVETRLRLAYKDYSKIPSILAAHHAVVTENAFSDSVELSVLVPESFSDKLKVCLTEATSGQIVVENGQTVYHNFV